MQITDQKSFLTGAFYLLAGIGGACYSAQYSLGNMARIGPGYFPLILGMLLALLGLILIVRAVSLHPEAAAGDPESRFRIELDGDFYVLLWILASVVLFGLLLKYLGLLISIFLLVVLASLASRGNSYRKILITAALVTLMSLLVFIYGLGLLIPIWPVFFN